MSSRTSDGPLVILKGETHSSLEDLEEEKDLMNQDIDVLVLEGSKTDKMNTTLANSWHVTTFRLFLWIFDNIWLSKEALTELASLQSAEIEFTRESNIEIFENSPLYMKATASISSYILFVFGIGLGIGVPIISSSFIGGFGIFCLSILTPVLVLRIVNMRIVSGDKNRDQIMAGKINEFIDGNARKILAIVGQGHLAGVKKRIRGGTKVKVRKAKSSAVRSTVKFFPQLIKSLLALFSLYILFIIFVTSVTLIL
ncbi:hypothetical protein AKJ44_02285 [candidate division MSBL1 archaeon SCGC-AAA261F17]|uniref:Uncharacterized protein n=1 Tax=candidate division MSBL1 archaeon SCGC-AAA261F17 TaxID=1698274 RepID=A0A133V5J9_9EURY|nr:hypothetical protein AKJ44_02285 [candidate division MSBL1 archaeon SCGC-AAA261F17]